MSADSHRLFPLPRTGSGSWRTYWMQRRDNGDAQTHCPDIVSEAEKLFGMSHGTGTYPRYDSNSAYMDSACDFTTLRGLQNSEWAQSIAQSAPSKIDKHNQSEVLGMLDHALALDPQCVTALQHRANLYIRLEQFSRAKSDISKLIEIHHCAGEGEGADADSLSLAIESLNKLLRKQSDAANSRQERRSSTAEGRWERRLSASPPSGPMRSRCDAGYSDSRPRRLCRNLEEHCDSSRCERNRRPERHSHGDTQERCGSRDKGQARRTKQHTCNSSSDGDSHPPRHGGSEKSNESHCAKGGSSAR